MAAISTSAAPVYEEGLPSSILAFLA